MIVLILVIFAVGFVITQEEDLGNNMGCIPIVALIALLFAFPPFLFLIVGIAVIGFLINMFK